MKDSQLEESARKLTAAAAREGSLQKEVREEQARYSDYKDKYENATRQSDGVLSQRKEALDQKVGLNPPHSGSA